MRPAHRIVALILLLTTVSSVTGCSTWRLETAPLPDVIARRPESLHVRTADSTVVLSSPTLRADTLSGFVGNQGGSAHFDTAAVRSVSTRHTNGVKSALVAGGMTIGIVAAIYLAACYNSSC